VINRNPESGGRNRLFMYVSTWGQGGMPVMEIILAPRSSVSMWQGMRIDRSEPRRRVARSGESEAGL
jgi:hypothetical protein